MLVLSRKSHESVVVGGSGALEQMVTVTVLEIKGDHVRLGFDADAAIPIHRSEVWERIRVGNGVGEEPAAKVVR
jgi:carbon storage regulator